MYDRRSFIKGGLSFLQIYCKMQIEERWVESP